MSAYILIVIAAALADLATTWYGLRHGFREANPLLSANPILLTIVYNAALIYILCGVVAKHYPSNQEEAWLVIGALRALPVVWNVYQLTRKSA